MDKEGNGVERGAGKPIMEMVREEISRRRLAERISEIGFDPDEMVRFDSPSYDDAVVGVTNDGRLVYDYELMAESLAKSDGISIEDAIEFIDYNAIGSLAGGDAGMPVVLYKFRD